MINNTAHYYAPNYPTGNNYHVSIMVSAESLCMAVLNKTTNNYDCIIRYEQGIAQLTQAQLTTDLKLLPTQINSAAAQLFKTGAYLLPNNTAVIDDLHTTTTDVLQLINATLHYNINGSTLDKLQQISPALTVCHHTQVAVYNALTSIVQQPNQSFVTATLVGKLLHVCVIKNGVFTLSNYYDSKHDDDIVYYILFAYNQLQLSNTEVELYLYANSTYTKIINDKLANFIQTIHITHTLPIPYTLHSSIDADLITELYPLLTMYACV